MSAAFEKLGHPQASIRTMWAKDNRKITRVKYSDGGIVKRFDYSNGECWWLYVAIPRQAVIDRIRYLRGMWGRTYSELASSLEHINYYHVLQPAHQGGPGEFFCGHPTRQHSVRKWVVLHQRGGLDI